MEVKTFVLGDFEMNSYLLIQSGQAILIDAGFDPQPIEDYLNENNISLQAILLTHTHLDHIGGLEYLREQYKVPVYVHVKEADWLMNSRLNGSDIYPYLGKVVCKRAEFSFDQEQLIKIGPFQIQPIHSPGHTPGGTSYYIKPKLFSGDTLFYHSVGRTDLYGGDQRLLIKQIHEKLYSLPDQTVVHPGHGPKTTIKEEKKNNPFT